MRCINRHSRDHLWTDAVPTTLFPSSSLSSSLPSSFSFSLEKYAFIVLIVFFFFFFFLIEQFNWILKNVRIFRYFFLIFPFFEDFPRWMKLIFSLIRNTRSILFQSNWIILCDISFCFSKWNSSDFSLIFTWKMSGERKMKLMHGIDLWREINLMVQFANKGNDNFIILITIIMFLFWE